MESVKEFKAARWSGLFVGMRDKDRLSLTIKSSEFSKRRINAMIVKTERK